MLFFVLFFSSAEAQEKNIPQECNKNGLVVNGVCYEPLVENKIVVYLANGQTRKLGRRKCSYTSNGGLSFDAVELCSGYNVVSNQDGKIIKKYVEGRSRTVLHPGKVVAILCLISMIIAFFRYRMYSFIGVYLILTSIALGTM